MPVGKLIVLWADPEVIALLSEMNLNRSSSMEFEFVDTVNEAKGRLQFDDPKIDSIVMDVRQGEDGSCTQGYDLLRSIREMDPDVPIVVLTADASGETAYRAGQAGARLVTEKHQILENSDRLSEFLDQLKAHVASSSYDVSQRDLANSVADQYLKIETERPGTIAYWMFEEEMIQKIVRAKEEKKKGPFKVLDLGCGTGRLGKAITDISESALVTCVDFSGRMLAEARATLPDGRCKFRRALAERLPPDFQDFDIVLLGFGFPCYAPTRRVLNEVKRVVAKDGWVFASVYNHDALAYEKWHGPDDDNQKPISTWIDRERGEISIRIGSKTESIPARTFTPGHFARELRHSKFHLGGYLTFPVLYSTLKCSEIGNIAELEKKSRSPYKDSYEHPQFSHELLEIDKQFSRSLKDKGFYAVFLGSPSKSSIEDVANSLHFHPAKPLQA